MDRTSLCLCPRIFTKEFQLCGMKAIDDIHRAIAIIIRFSVRETKPSGTLLSPPTQAHLSSRRSI